MCGLGGSARVVRPGMRRRRAAVAGCDAPRTGCPTAPHRSRHALRHRPAAHRRVHPSPGRPLRPPERPLAGRGTRSRPTGPPTGRSTPCATRPRPTCARSSRTAAAESAPGTLGAKVGDLYASFMDEAAVEARGRQPLEADLADIRAVTDLAGLLAVMARLQLQGAVGGFLAPYVNTDAQRLQPLHRLPGAVGTRACPTSRTTTRSRSPRSARPTSPTSPGCCCWPAGRPTSRRPQAAADRIMALETAIADRHWNNVDTRDAAEVLQPARAGRRPRVHRRRSGSASGSRP